jgi:hypothetical protein
VEKIRPVPLEAARIADLVGLRWAAVVLGRAALD